MINGYGGFFNLYFSIIVTLILTVTTLVIVI